MEKNLIQFKKKNMFLREQEEDGGGDVKVDDTKKGLQKPVDKKDIKKTSKEEVFFIMKIYYISNQEIS